MWALFQKGGPVMWPLAILSVLTVAVIIEKIYSLRKSKVIQGEIVSCIESIRTLADIPLAMKICERFDSPFANIVQAGLLESTKPIFIVRQAMEDTGRREVKRLERYMVVLETAAAAGPMSPRPAPCSSPAGWAMTWLPAPTSANSAGRSP